MNTKTLFSHYDEDVKRYVLLSVLALAGILLNIIFYLAVIKPQSKAYAAIKAKRGQHEEMLRKYSDVPAMTAAIQQNKKKAEGLTKEYAIFFSKNNEKDRMAMDEMEKIRARTGIVIDHYSPAGEELGIALKANYSQMIAFLLQLERSFSIEQLSINADGINPSHNIVLNVKRLTMEEPSDVPPDDFIALYTRTTEMIKGIESSTNVSESTGTAKDPFMLQGTLYPIEAVSKNKAGNRKKPPPPVVIQPPSLVIESIIWENELPLVIIKGKIYREGDVVEGARIVKIHRNMVTVNWKSVDFSLVIMRKEMQ